jgi:hypothetical protein
MPRQVKKTIFLFEVNCHSEMTPFLFLNRTHIIYSPRECPSVQIVPFILLPLNCRFFNTIHMEPIWANVFSFESVGRIGHLFLVLPVNLIPHTTNGVL